MKLDDSIGNKLRSRLWDRYFDEIWIILKIKTKLSRRFGSNTSGSGPRMGLKERLGLLEEGT